MGDAVDVKAADGVQEEEEGGGELAPEHQSEADERDLVPEEDHKTQKARRGEDERDEEEDGAQGPLAPCVEVLTHLGYHEELQAKNGSHHGQGTPAADQDHAHSQPWHVGLTQVSEALWPSLIGGGTEMPQPKEAVLSQEPVAITDGDRGEDHGQGSTHDDEGPDEGFKEGPTGPPLAQQPLGLEDAREGHVKRGPCRTPSNLFREDPKHAFHLPTAMFPATVSREAGMPPLLTASSPVPPYLSAPSLGSPPPFYLFPVLHSRPVSIDCPVIHQAQRVP